IRFQSRQGFTNPAARTFFELLPVLRNLRNLVTSSRALGADDYVLPTEQRTEPLPGTSAKRWDLEALEQQLVEAAGTLQDELDDLQDLLAAVPDGALATDPTQVPDLSGVDFEGLRNALVRLSLYGIPG